MSGTMARFFGHTISSEAFDTKLGQVVCFVAAVVLLAVSMWKLTQLDLNGEAQFFFGLLLSLCVPLLLVIVGLVLPMGAAAWKHRVPTIPRDG